MGKSAAKAAPPAAEFLLSRHSAGLLVQKLARSTGKGKDQNYVLLEAGDGGKAILGMAYDGEALTRRSVLSNSTLGASGSCCLELSRLAQLVRTLRRDSDDICITWAEGADSVEIRTHGVKLRLPAIEPPQHPAAGRTFEAGGGSLYFGRDQWLEHAEAACSFRDETSTRYALGGTYVEAPMALESDCRVLLVCTDGRRLICCEARAETADQWPSCVLPPRAVEAATSMCHASAPGSTLRLEAIPDRDGGVGKVRVALGLDEVVTSLVHGRFPDWRVVIDPDKPASFPMPALRVPDAAAAERLRLDCQAASAVCDKGREHVAISGGVTDGDGHAAVVRLACKSELGESLVDFAAGHPGGGGRLDSAMHSPYWLALLAAMRAPFEIGQQDRNFVAWESGPTRRVAMLACTTVE